MNLDLLKNKLIPFLEPYKLEVYSIKLKREYGEKIVEILLDTDVLDIEDLEKIHMSYIESLDDEDLDDDYFLEISSLGAERPIDTIEQLAKQVTKYIYFETNNKKVYGTLLSVDIEQQVFIVEVNEKGRIRKLEFNYTETRKMRTAVKV